MRRLVLLLSAVTLAAGCSGNRKPDAYGTFEANEVVVAAETSGQLLTFTAAEGAQLARGTIVGIVDTSQLALERAQLVARLFTVKAATAQQLDQAERDYRVLGAQIEAARAQRQSVLREITSGEARVAQITERLNRSRIANPERGTVLTTFVHAGEVVQPGQSLYRIANLDTLTLRAYVSEAQLHAIRLGQPVRVNVDAGDGKMIALPGRISWVAAKAEFTPTPVQTRDERAALVYAVKVLVPNRDGVLKIGMPADLDLMPSSSRA